MNYVVYLSRVLEKKVLLLKMVEYRLTIKLYRCVSQNHTTVYVHCHLLNVPGQREVIF